MADDVVRVRLEPETTSVDEARRHRRERIATAVLAGVLAGAASGEFEELPSHADTAAEFAVLYADALIAALDAEPTDGE